MDAGSQPEQLEIVRLRAEARLPRRAHPGDAGYDLFSAEDFELPSGERGAVATGLGLALPANIAGLVVPRSGLAARHGISVVNGPGLIDPNYRGEIKVVLINLGEALFQGHCGDRIAQLLLVPFETPPLRWVETLRPSGDLRGIRGFGSSGR
jgi:dUTP pyrophosphatase